MKINVGDYVRTKYGEICQLKEPKYNGLIYSTDIEIDRYNDRDCNDYGFDNDTIKDIIKSSPNIIDLIEVGDILVIKDFVDEACMIFIDTYLIQNEEQLLNIKNDLEKNKNKKLYSIMTKEQFKSMEYKI